ncbi:MAG TPA: radical SAM protein [Elusimicrobiota bacterium]|nr:radical SAM protein [Elusimicrobiota bacterium]
MNHLRFGARLLWAHATGARVPLQLNIHVTDVCNLRCAYCYVDFDHAIKDLPLDALKKAISEARACGTERISLEGGEPTARKDIGDLVDPIVDLGSECNINTNGYFIPRHVQRLKRAAMLSVSLDGPKEVHDRLRGPGSFDKAVEGIRVARANGIRVHILSVLTKHNRAHVDYMLGLAESLGCSWVPNSLFFMAGVKIDREQAKEYAIDDEDYRRLLGELVEKKRLGRPIVWSESTLRYAGRWPESYFQSNMFEERAKREAGFEPVQCQAARFFVVMQTNGDLYSCDPLLGYGKPANAVELGFAEAFRRTTTHGCVACNSIVCNEYHQLFGMRPSVIGNLLSSYKKDGPVLPPSDPAPAPAATRE